MTNYNPNSTPTKGPEWKPTIASAVALNSGTKMAAMSLIQSAGAVIANERIYVGSIPVRGGIYAVEVYDDENAVTANLDETSRVAVAYTDVAIGSWLTDVGGSSNLYLTMQDIPAYAGTGGYIKTTATTRYDGHLKTTTGISLTGKRIVGIGLAYEVAHINTTIQLGLRINSVDVPLPFTMVDHGHDPGDPTGWSSEAAYIVNQWPYNPVTNKPWTIADLQAFESTSGYGWYAQNTIDGPGLSSQAQIRGFQIIIIVVDETRLAVGTLNDSVSGLTANAWNDAAVLTPTGGAWTKDGAGSHLYTIRRISATGSLSIPTLAAVAAPTSVGEGFSPTVDPSYGYVTVMGSATPALFGLIQRTSAPANSTDSQAYVALVEGLVYSGRVAQQEFSNAAATPYGIVTALVKPNGAVGDLLIKVKKRSDDSQLGSTITYTAAEVAALPDAGNGWKLLQRQMASAGTLAGSTQYYVDFSDVNAGDDGTGTKYWSVLVLDNAGQGADTGFGGTTDRATINGAEADRYDIAATVATVPVAPSGQAAALSHQMLAVPDDTGGCDIAQIDRASISWSATALGGSFDTYEIERSDDGGTTWSLIFLVLAENVLTVNDYEGKRNTASLYRVRVVRTDGAFSDWVETGSVTPTPQSCEMLFVSNVVPTRNVGYNYPPDLDYKFPSSDEVVLAAIYQRDFRVAMVPSEDRGVAFATQVFVNLGATPLATGAAAYAALRELSRDPTIPYVCVLDADGNRYYANLNIPSGSTNRPGAVQVAQIQVAEVSADPFPVSITST